MPIISIKPTPGKKLLLADLLKEYNLQISSDSDVTPDWELFNDNGEAQITMEHFLEVGDLIHV